MLPKLYRLPKYRIHSVLTTGKRVVSRALHVYYLDSETTNSRFAYIISKRIQKSAVKRNYIKRVLRESCLLIHSRISHPVDVVITVTSQFTIQEKSQLGQGIYNMISQQQ